MANLDQQDEDPWVQQIAPDNTEYWINMSTGEAWDKNFEKPYIAGTIINDGQMGTGLSKDELQASADTIQAAGQQGAQQSAQVDKFTASNLTPPSTLPDANGVQINTLDPDTRDKYLKKADQAVQNQPGTVPNEEAPAAPPVVVQSNNTAAPTGVAPTQPGVAPGATKLQMSSSGVIRRGNSMQEAKALLDTTRQKATDLEAQRAEQATLEAQGLVLAARREEQFRQYDEEANQKIQASAAHYAKKIATIHELQQLRLQTVQADFDNAVNSFANAKMDPDKFWNDRGTAGRIMGAIAMAMGAAGSSLTGGPNYAMQIIDNAIQRDLMAQKANIDKKGQMIQVAGSRMAMTKQFFKDQETTELAYQAASYQRVQQDLARMKAAYGSTSAGITELQNALGIKIAETRVKHGQTSLADTQKNVDQMQAQARLEMERVNSAIKMENLTGKNKQLPRVNAPPGATGVRFMATAIDYGDGTVSDPDDKMIIAAKEHGDKAQLIYLKAVNLMKAYGDTGATAETRKARQVQAALALFQAAKGGGAEALDDGFQKIMGKGTGQNTFDIASVVTADTVTAMKELVETYLGQEVPATFRTKYDLEVTPSQAEYWAGGLNTAYKAAFKVAPAQYTINGAQ